MGLGSGSQAWLKQFVQVDLPLSARSRKEAMGVSTQTVSPALMVLQGNTRNVHGMNYVAFTNCFLIVKVPTVTELAVCYCLYYTVFIFLPFGMAVFLKGNTEMTNLCRLAIIPFSHNLSASFVCSLIHHPHAHRETRELFVRAGQLWTHQSLALNLH